MYGGVGLGDRQRSLPTPTFCDPVKGAGQSSDVFCWGENGGPKRAPTTYLKRRRHLRHGTEVRVGPERRRRWCPELKESHQPALLVTAHASMQPSQAATRRDGSDQPLPGSAELGSCLFLARVISWGFVLLNCQQRSSG